MNYQPGPLGWSLNLRERCDGAAWRYFLPDAWSSYRAHAEGAPDRLVGAHELYDRMGATAGERAEVYRALFQTALDEDFVQALRVATNGGWALGSDRFKHQIAQALARRVAPAPRGRPKRAKVDDDQRNLL